jgi:protein gp37
MATIALTPELDWLLLTKRPEYAAKYLAAPDLYRRILDAAGAIRTWRPELGRIGISSPAGDSLATWWPHLWVGTSVEDQRAANERIPHLLRIPARVRFLSMEPLLGPVDLTAIHDPCHAGEESNWNALTGEDYCEHGYNLSNAPHRRVQWVIAGGESGRHARPMHPDWVRSVRDQCTAAGVPFHFKQWGEYAANGEHLGKHHTGRVLDGQTWDQFPAPI